MRRMARWLGRVLFRRVPPLDERETKAARIAVLEVQARAAVTRARQELAIRADAQNADNRVRGR